MWFVSFRLEAGIFYFASFRSQFSTAQLFFLLLPLMHPNPVPGPWKKLRKCTSFGTLPFAVWFVPYRGPIAIPGVSLCSQASIREPCRLVCHPGWLRHGRARYAERGEEPLHTYNTYPPTDRGTDCTWESYAFSIVSSCSRSWFVLWQRTIGGEKLWLGRCFMIKGYFLVTKRVTCTFVMTVVKKQ